MVDGRNPSPLDEATPVANDVPTRHNTAAASQGPRVGEVVRARFRLERLIGQGGMGQVFMATDLNRENYGDREPHVAIKFLGGDFAAHPQAAIALQRESRNAQRLSHPNIVKVFDFDQTPEHVFMTMEYMHGTPLDKYIERTGALPFEQAWPIIQGMAAGLDHIHQNRLVHADFKPTNVFVGDDATVKILDLGIARVFEDANRTRGATRFDAAALGAMTPEYAACEMFEGARPDPRDDVYALACVAYVVLTGRHPFDGVWSIKARAAGVKPRPVPGLSRRRQRALLRGLAFDRKNRTPSVAAFVRDMAAARGPTLGRVFVGISAGAVLVAGALLLVMTDPDREFVRAKLAAAPASADADADVADDLERWLAQGAELAEFGRSALEDGDLLVGHMDLSGGSSNAWAAFEAVLARRADERAARGMLAVVEAYASGAERAEARGDSADAIWLWCRAWQLHPRHRSVADAVAHLTVDSAGVEAACARVDAPGVRSGG